MVWIGTALAGYFFNAVAAVLDKYILSSRIPEPSANALLVSFLSLFALALLPFGVSLAKADAMAAALLSGALFIFHLLPFYAAVKEGEVSRAAPLVGALVSLWLFLFSLAEGFVSGSGTYVDAAGLFAFGLLLSGSLLMAFRFPVSRRFFLAGFSSALSASLLLALSLALLKHVYVSEGFLSGFFWSRMGSFVGGLALLCIPACRHSLRKAFARSASGSRREGWTTAAAVLADKTAATLGAVLVSYAVFLGPLPFVQALGGTQFAFVFVLGALLSGEYPSVYGEEPGMRSRLQKAAAIILIAAGVALVPFV
jgi:hypothetical protein